MFLSEMNVLLPNEKEPNEKEKVVPIFKVTDVEGNVSKTNEQLCKLSEENESMGPLR